MGISEFILKKKARKPIRHRENIRLQKPVVNLFAGSFQKEEYDALMNLLGGRIGSSNKVHYCQLSERTSDSDEKKHFKILWAEGLDIAGEYNLDMRRKIQEDGKQKIENLRNMAADYVNDIFNEVSTTVYSQKARIRLNVLVKPDDIQASLLSVFLPVLKEEFLVYFPNGVHVDAYVFLDQKGYKKGEKGDERKAFSYLSLSEIDSMVREKVIQMPFMLSNYTSDDCLDVDCGEERMTAAGLMMLVKDGISANGQEQVDHYDDSIFAEDCGQGEGFWYSVGHFRLEVARNLIDHIVYRTIMQQIQKVEDNREDGVKLSQMQLSEDQIDQNCAEVMGLSSFPPEIFYSMVKNRGVNVAAMVNDARGVVIQDVYGGNLELFYKLNCTRWYQERIADAMVVQTRKIQTVLTAMYEDEGYSLADMNMATNDILHHLEAIEKRCAQLKEAEHKSLDYWLEEKSGIANLTDVVRETGEPRAFYQLASQYLEKRAKGLHVEIKSEMVKQYIEAVKTTARQYQRLAGSVEEAERELFEDIRLMEEDELPIKYGNCEDYYSGLVRKLTEEDNRFHNFIRKLNSRICSGEVEGEQLFDAIVRYCDESILTDKRFKNDFAMEMLGRLKNFKKFNTEESIYDFAFETIMDNQKFYASYDTFANVNREVCFMVNPGNQFVTGANKRMQKLKASRQLKVFFEEYFNDMDVLFMEGRFDIKTLYNYSVYENTWKKLANTEENNGCDH